MFAGITCKVRGFLHASLAIFRSHVMCVCKITPHSCIQCMFGTGSSLPLARIMHHVKTTILSEYSSMPMTTRGMWTPSSTWFAWLKTMSARSGGLVQDSPGGHQHSGGTAGDMLQRHTLRWEKKTKKNKTFVCVCVCVRERERERERSYQSFIFLFISLPECAAIP